MPSQHTYRPTSFSGQNWPKNAFVFHPDYSGKEKDSETGYHYFGARYYNSDLSLWLSVDPMSDKHPSLSPYNYCAWNPTRLVDHNGKEILIFDGEKHIKYTAGMSSENLKGFSKVAVDALNAIYNSGGDEGAEMINALCSSKNVFNLKQRRGMRSEFISSKNQAAYARNDENLLSNWNAATMIGLTEGSGGDVMWNTHGYDIITTEGLKKDPVYQLVHELCHAYDANLGTLDGGMFKGFDNDVEIPLSEWSACMRANCIGSYMGYPKQTIYGGSVNSSGKYIEGTGTRLFDTNGIPFNPF